MLEEWLTLTHTRTRTRTRSPARTHTHTNIHVPFRPGTRGEHLPQHNFKKTWTKAWTCFFQRAWRKINMQSLATSWFILILHWSLGCYTPWVIEADAKWEAHLDEHLECIIFWRRRPSVWRRLSCIVSIKRQKPHLPKHDLSCLEG